MTRVDFYVLEGGDAAGHDRMICRVVEKAWQRGHQVFIACHDHAQAAIMDDLLWQFRDVSFVPHAIDGPGPVVIGTDPSGMQAPDVLVNLAQAVPEAASRYERVIESAGFDDASRGAARERYRYYQERGFPLNTHKVRN